MSAQAGPRGNIYRCPVCGAEVLVVARAHGAFRPHCCNVPMLLNRYRARFFVCRVCGSEIAALKPPNVTFAPHCCNTRMLSAA